LVSELKIASLGSGSSGNATLIDSGDGLIMIDCGFSMIEVERRLERINRSVADIAALLVTHEHSDHLCGVGALARKHRLPVYSTHGTAQRLADWDRIAGHIIHADQPFELLGLTVHPVPVPHDAREPVQFVLSNGPTKVGILTDLGSLTAHILQVYSGCQMILVEANHDYEMLMNGRYPAPLKKRVSGRWGHLNNHQTAEFLKSANAGLTLRSLVLGHISKHNNDLQRVREAVAEATAGIDQIHYAQQDEPLDWVACEHTQEKQLA
jgi:phosphoribosyl 1,2-cyclic phosphodiesterase